MEEERREVPYAADERAMLVAWLEYHRATLAMKCSGLDDEQLRERSVPPSSLSLLGLVRHMAEVERGWFRRVLGGEEAPRLYRSKEEPDGDFDGVPTADVGQAFDDWRAECQHAMELVEGAPSLEVAGDFERGDPRRGEPVSLRWILTHMIEEYARHNGHADLIRERIDGSVGD
jgi:uncharacterized damage-inducible protein DinB